MIFTPFETWWPNIEAAVLCAIPGVGGWLWQHRKLVRLVVEHKHQMDVAHAKIDALQDTVNTTHDKLDALHAKVDAGGTR